MPDCEVLTVLSKKTSSQNWTGIQPNEWERFLRICIPVDDFRLRANWRAVHAFNRAKSNYIKQKMKTLIRSLDRSPMRSGFFTLAIALSCFALSPVLKPADCPTFC